MRDSKTFIQPNKSTSDFDFQQHFNQLEIAVRQCALNGDSIRAQLEDLDNLKVSTIETIKSEGRKLNTNLKRELSRCQEKMAEPKDRRVANQLKKQEPEKDAAIAAIRKKTLDKKPPLVKKQKKLDEMIDRNIVEIDFILRHDYNSIWPNRNMLYDYPLRYAALLTGFGALDWNFSRNALAAYGGFDRASAAIIAVAMGAALCICTHFFGEALQKKNKLRKLGFGITGAILCAFITFLRIKF